MTSMSKQKLSKIADFNPSRKISRGQNAPFIDMAALPVNSRDISDVGVREFNGSGSRFSDGDTLFARITPCLENGKTAKVSGLGNGVVGHGSTEFIVMAAKEPAYDENFVYYIARHPDFRAFAKARMEGTSGRQRVAWQSIADFEFNFPEKEQRWEIGKILAALDDKIALNRQINQNLEQVAQAIFKSWFVDFEPVKAKIEAKAADRDPGRAAMCAISGKLDHELDQLPPEQRQQLAATATLFPDELVESELGLIPVGWGVGGLDCLATLVTKSVSPSSAPNSVFEHYSIPAFDASSQPVYETGKSIKSNKYLVDSSAVLVSKLNPETPRIWYPSVKTARPICSTEFMQFVPKLKADRPFLYLLMKSETMQSEILQRVTGSTGSRQRAQPSQIAVLPTVVPECELRLSFCNTAATLLSQIGANLDQSEELSTLRDALLPKLLSGAIEINDVAIGG
jgi:type I restriction enzyme S subunit